MLSALKKQLQMDRRALRGVAPAVAPIAVTHQVPVEVEFTETPLPPLSAADAEKLEAVRASHPRLHESLSALDSVQLAAVLSDAPSLLVRAPVGSGKTTVLVHKVLYLHFVRGVPLRELAVLTFTNRAAAEIRARITALSATALADDDFWLTGTFHGVARALLARRLPLEKLGYRADFSVLDEEQQETIFDELIRTRRLRVGRRSTLRARLRQVADGKTESGGDLARLAQLFAEEKRRRNTMDFDDLIDHATTLLPEPGTGVSAVEETPMLPEPGTEVSAVEETPLLPEPGTGASAVEKTPLLPEPGAEVSAAENGNPAGVSDPLTLPRWLIVDELQDCEPRELALLSRLRGAGTGFFAVGDPYQAIYGWRGSDPELFAQAEATFQCSPVALPRNYRSTRTIVDSARSVLGFQPGRPSGTLSAARSFGERLVVRRHHDPVSEALYLAECITRLHASGIPYHELAILFRLRAQAEPLRAALTARNIPCSEPGEEARDAVQLLTLHAAKGLEFQQVFLSGINEGLVPLGHRFALCGDAEERRLLFVGLTRARDRVEISYHVRPHEFAAAGEPSRYLSFIPRALVAWEDAPPASAVCEPVLAAAPSVPASESSWEKSAEPILDSASTKDAARDADGRSDAALSSPWQTGQAVRHPRYGAGVVVQVAAGTVHCTFGKFGERSFPLSLCPLLPGDSAR